MIPAFKNLRLNKIGCDFRFDRSHYIYRKDLTPVTRNALAVIGRRLNVAFVNQIISLEYICNDCYMRTPRHIFSGSCYSKTISRLDNQINRDPSLKARYFEEILRKKCEIDLTLISSSMTTA